MSSRFLSQVFGLETKTNELFQCDAAVFLNHENTAAAAFVIVSVCSRVLTTRKYISRILPSSFNLVSVARSILFWNM